MPAASQPSGLVLVRPDGRECLRLRRVRDGARGEILEVQGRLLPGMMGPRFTLTRSCVRKPRSRQAGLASCSMLASMFSFLGKRSSFPQDQITLGGMRGTRQRNSAGGRFRPDASTVICRECSLWSMPARRAIPPFFTWLTCSGGAVTPTR